MSNKCYYSFGMLMPDRSNAGQYRFGFQNQEQENDIAREGDFITFKYRMNDTRLGRFLSVDPLYQEYPWNSPYAFCENRLLDGIELEGLEKYPVNTANPFGLIMETFRRFADDIFEGLSFKANLFVKKTKPKDDLELTYVSVEYNIVDIISLNIDLDLGGLMDHVEKGEMELFELPEFQVGLSYSHENEGVLTIRHPSQIPITVSMSASSESIVELDLIDNEISTEALNNLYKVSVNAGTENAQISVFYGQDVDKESIGMSTEIDFFIDPNGNTYSGGGGVELSRSKEE